MIGPTDDPATPVNEGVYLDAAKAILDRLGVPYDLATYSGSSLPALPPLEDAATNHGHYQGVIFALSDWRMNPYLPRYLGGADTGRR